MPSTAATTYKPRAATAHDVHVGGRIRYYRHERKISQDDLGGQLGITFQQIQKYEKGVNRLSGERLQQIAAIFRCDVGDLLPATKRNGKAKPSTHYERMMTMQDGRRLIGAFLKIDDARLRSALVKVAQEFAKVAT